MAERIRFRLILPPGWSNIPLDDPTPDSIRAVAKQIATRTEVGARAQVEAFVFDQLATAANQARRVGGQDLILPTREVDGLAMPMTVVVAASAPIREGAKGQSDALLAYAGAHDGAQASEIAGVLAVRSVTAGAAGDAQTDPSRAYATRRIGYILAAPIPTHQMMVITCTIQRFDHDADGSIVDSMAFLFDAILGTLRFETAVVPNPSEAPA
jgi:hypothetical protein